MVIPAVAVAAMFGANVKSVNISILDMFSIPPSPQSELDLSHAALTHRPGHADNNKAH
jgi:hypothetical protein